jgi:hypothetical protein
MKKLSLMLPILFIFLLAFAGGDGTKVAIIKLKKGTATIISADGTKTNAKKGLWVTQGSVVKTEGRSFVKLSFIDKSTMSVGPKSEMKIEKFSKNEAGVINVISGKIRSKVSKDYLRMDKDKSKLFVKSKSAVMGIRGTDFAFTMNKKTGASTAVLFEGSVVFNRINKGNRKLDLESIVNKGQRIKPGQFSIVNMKMTKPTVPAKMSSKQIKKLEKNENFVTNSSDKSQSKKLTKSIVPPGLSGEIIANDGKSLEQGIKSIVKINIEHKEKVFDEKSQSDSKGYVNGDSIKPADGAIVHIDSGTVIPIGNDAVYDKNNGEWVSNSVGSVDDKGTYIPPADFKMTDDGKLLKEVGNKVHVVDTNIKSIDNVPSMDKIQTQVFVPQPIKGPTPAGQIDNVEPIDQAFGTEPTEIDGSFLPPPIPQGESFTPNTYNNYGPTGPAGTTPSGKTRANVNVIKVD